VRGAAVKAITARTARGPCDLCPRLIKPGERYYRTLRRERPGEQGHYIPGRSDPQVTIYVHVDCFDRHRNAVRAYHQAAVQADLARQVSPPA
jgi:hypothetical protein